MAAVSCPLTERSESRLVSCPPSEPPLRTGSTRPGQLTVRSPAYYRLRIKAFAASISAKSTAYVADSRLPGPAKPRQWFQALFFGVLPLRPTAE